MNHEFPERKKEAPKSPERLRTVRPDRGALLAAALLASVQSVPLRAEEPSEARQELGWETRRRVEGPAFRSFIDSLTQHARDNSREGGHETARLYQARRGRDVVLDIEDRASSDQVIIDWDTVDQTLEARGSVLLCHTHPLNEQISGIEERSYVNPPSQTDILNVFNHISTQVWSAVPEGGDLLNARQYRNRFVRIARRLEQCIATPGSGYWRLRISSVDTAIAWMDTHSEANSTEREARSEAVLLSLEQGGFFETPDLGSRYTSARDNRSVDELSIQLERDLMNGALTREAQRLAEDFMDAYYELRVQDENYLRFGEEYRRLQETTVAIFDTSDMAATEDEYRVFQEEILRLFGVQVDWVPVANN